MSDEIRTRTLEEIRNERIEKNDTLIKIGMETYPSSTSRTHDFSQVLESFEKLKKDTTLITIAGRVMAIREHGGSIFIDMFDGNADL